MILDEHRSNYLHSCFTRLYERSTILKLFTVTDLFKIDKDITTTSNITLEAGYKSGDILVGNNGKIGYVDIDNVTVKFLSNDQPILHIYDTFDLKGGTLQCCKDTVNTTLGLFLLNLHCLEEPFKGIVPYNNDVWKAGDLSKKVSQLLVDGKITVEQTKRFINTSYFITGMCDIFTPSISERGLTTDKRIRKLREDFIKEHKDELSDPVVLVQLEKMLVDADKAYLEGDSSKIFFDGMGSKAYKMQRKKMFLTSGISDAFEDGTGNYQFIDKPLMDGWDPKDIPSIANETRKGCYNRGMATRDGGAQTKFILRVFQDLAIKTQDCGSKVGIRMDLSRKNISDYIGRTIMENGKRVLITEENCEKYRGKVVEILGPRTCKSKHGLCYTCVGQTFLKLKVYALATLASEISSTFLSFSMANMHGVVIETKDINVEDYFI